jgi:hypothetical protein
MTLINAVCDDCGDVELTPDDLVVVVDGIHGSGTYAFDCPTCDAAVTQYVSARLAQLLVAAGVFHTVVEAPPLGLSDIELFARLLADDDVLAAAVSSLAG